VTRILIIGGGIAGTSAALAAHKAGIEATVFERPTRTAAPTSERSSRWPATA
jgi:2-polyprenyl-6-methoxyphenol hydroxylase-like FAD-dependent oxidoreductase